MVIYLYLMNGTRYKKKAPPKRGFCVSIYNGDIIDILETRIIRIES